MQREQDAEGPWKAFGWGKIGHTKVSVDEVEGNHLDREVRVLLGVLVSRILRLLLQVNHVLVLFHGLSLGLIILLVLLRLHFLRTRARCLVLGDGIKDVTSLRRCLLVVGSDALLAATRTGSLRGGARAGGGGCLFRSLGRGVAVAGGFDVAMALPELLQDFLRPLLSCRCKISEMRCHWHASGASLSKEGQAKRGEVAR